VVCGAEVRRRRRGRRAPPRIAAPAVARRPSSLPHARAWGGNTGRVVRNRRLRAGIRASLPPPFGIQAARASRLGPRGQLRGEGSPEPAGGLLAGRAGCGELGPFDRAIVPVRQLDDGGDHPLAVGVVEPAPSEARVDVLRVPAMGRLVPHRLQRLEVTRQRLHSVAPATRLVRSLRAVP
jgi:hypothetical protein